MRAFRSRLALLAALAASIGCSGDKGGVAGVLVVSQVDVTPGIGSVVIGTTTQLTASPRTASGLAVPGRTVIWTSLDPAVASVSSTGTVTGVTVGGPVTIRANVDGIRGEALITVHAVPVNSVTVTPASNPLVAGGSVQLTPTALDAGGLPLPGRVFLWQSSDPAVAAVTSTGMVLAVSAGGPVTITASTEGKSGGATVTVTARPADRLGFSQQPPASTAGAPFNPTIKVAIQDNLLGTVATASHPVTIQLAANPGNATLSGATTVNAVNGIATFGNLSLNRVGTGYTFLATSPELTSATSNPFNITAGAAVQLILATPPPATAQSGAPLSQQPAVQLLDASGNNVAQAGVVVTATLASGPGTLGGTVTATTSGAGVATFTSLAITGPAGAYTLGFSAPGAAPLTSGPITVGAGLGAALVMVTQPSVAGQSGVPLPQQPSVRIQDAAGNPVPQGGVVVTATLATGTGALGGFTTATTNTSGVAAFTSLAINGVAGLYTLQFSAPGVTPIVSGSIALGAGTPTQLAVTVEPSATAQVGIPFTQQPTVQLRDASSNPVATPGVPVTVSASAGGSVLGTASATTNSAGAAAFTGLSLSGPAGNYTLTFSSGALAPATSATIALSAGVAAQLGLTTQPSSTAQSGVGFTRQPVAQVQDGGGNPVSTAGVVVTASIASGPAGGVLGGTLAVTTSSGGSAAFTNLGISGPSGAYTLRFSGPGLAAATSSAVTIGSGVATTMVANSVTTQSASAGGAAIPPSVRVTDASANPVAGVPVTFAVTAGGGTVLPAAPVLTDASGIATAASWTLGATAGTNNNTVTATSAGLTGSPVTFTASGLVGPANRILSNSPTSQSGTVSSTVTAPSVRVTDVNNNPVAGIAVTFTLSAPAGGSIVPGSPATVSTNALGVASLTTWTLGSAAGVNNNVVTATAAVPNGSPVTFTASATAAAPGSMVANSPTALTATVNTAVATPPSVKVLDGSSNPVPGVSVTFTVGAASGSTVPASPAVIVTDGAGVATLTSWTLGTVAGSQTVTASATGLPSITFTATASAGAANQVAASSVTSQSAQVGQAVSNPPAVLVTDQFGNPVSGFAVSFAVTSAGGGSVVPAAPATVTTGASGIAAATSWTLGPGVGANTVSATAAGLTGSPVVFTATGTAGSATNIAANSATTLTAVAGTAVAPAPSVKVTDSIGNPVQGVVVTFVASGGGSVTGPAAIATDASGMATVGGWILSGTAGTNNNTLSATAGSLVGSPVNFIASGTVGPAALITAQSSTSQSATVGTAVTAPSVRVTDINGNVVSGFSVTFTLTQSGAPGGGSIVPASPASVSTDGSGIATLTGWTLGSTTGTSNNTVTATGTGLATITFNASGTAGAAATISANAPISQSGTVNTTVTAPSVRVTDAFGNPVAGAGVTFTVAGGGTISPASPATVNTDALGVASLGSWTLGPTAGTNNNTVTATAGSLSGSPVTFVASGAAGPPTTLSAASSTSQSATVGSAVTPPSVLVTDNAGNPIAGVSVTFTVTAGGAIAPATPATIITNGSGLATLTSWTLSTTAGANTVTASSGTLAGSPVTFSATGTAGAAANFAANSATTPSAAAGTAVAAPPSIRVTDSNGNPVQGVAVTFTVTSAGGTIVPASPAVINTNASGVATLTSWTLDPVAGNANTIQATGAGTGSPVTFTATGTVGPAASMTAVSLTSQSATVGSAVAAPPSVKVIDAQGNAVSGFAVTFAHTPIAGGSISPASPATVNTDVSGVATLSTWTLGNAAGTSNNSVTASGVGPAVVFMASGTAGPAASIAANSVITQSATVATNAATPPSVLVTDAFSNPVANVTVSFVVAAPPNGALVNSASAATIQTSAAGVASLTSWTLGTVAGTDTNTVTAASTGLSGSPVTFKASGVAGAPILTITTEPPTTGVSGAALAPATLISVKDVHGNAIAGTLVTVTLATGSGALSGTLTVTTDANGAASFANIIITGSGSHTLKFAAPGPTEATSIAISIS